MWLVHRTLVVGDIELPCERLGQHFAHVLARTARGVLLGPVQVPVRAMKLSAGAFLAAFLAALDAFQFEVASVLGLLSGCRPSLFEFLTPYRCALALYVGDHVRDLLELRRVKPLQPFPRYPPRFHQALPTMPYVHVTRILPISIHKNHAKGATPVRAGNREEVTTRARSVRLDVF